MVNQQIHVSMGWIEEVRLIASSWLSEKTHGFKLVFDWESVRWAPQRQSSWGGWCLYGCPSLF